MRSGDWFSWGADKTTPSRFDHMPNFSVRSVAKGLREMVCSRLPSRIPSGSSLVLAYHNIVMPSDVGHGDRSLHLSVEHFSEQLRTLASEVDLVSLPELLSSHGRQGRRVAVTFDDAYRGCLRLGIPACAAAGVRSTIFVAPSLLGGFVPWDLWSVQGMWSEADRSRFLNVEKGVVTTFSPCDDLPSDYSIGTLAELEEVVGLYPVDIGNHTMRHVNLARTEQADALREIIAADSALQRLPSSVIPCLAYPYGNPPSKETQSAIPADVVSHAFLVSGGWIRRADSISGLAIPRLNVPNGISEAKFRAQIRGWLIS